MAKVTNAFTTYGAIGNREDLTDAIYNITPSDTPLLSMLPRAKAEAVNHEWQSDALAAADVGNAQLEGDETARAATTPTTRLRNICQISSKNATVSGTQSVVKHAGRDDEMAYQMAKKVKELKIDMETIISGNQGLVAGADGTARKTRSMESWLATNDSRGATGADAASETAAATDGTQRAITETILKDVIQKCYVSGGNPSVALVGAWAKQQISGFAGRASAHQTVGAQTILASASLYASDFGDIKVQPSRRLRSLGRTALLIDPEYAAVAYLRSFERFNLAKIGDADSKVILSEYCLEMRNEAAHGVAADLSTS